MVPIFVINLPKDSDRKAFMQAQFDRFGVNAEFVPGWYGDHPDVIAACDDELAKKEHGKVLTIGEKGCAYSHRSIYEKMEHENIPCALIFEDDAVIPDGFFDIVERELARTPRNWEWLSFDYPRIGPTFIKAWLIASRKEIAKRKSFFLYALIKFPFITLLSFFEWLRDVLASRFPSYAGPKLFYRPLYNAGAYLITLQGYRNMKPLLYPLRFSADRTPNQARVKTGLAMRWYVPLIVRQHDGVDGFTSNTI